jgi:hypothetical protein
MKEMGGCGGGFIWLRIGTTDEFLWTWLWTFGLHEIMIISLVAQDVLDSDERLCSKELLITAFAWRNWGH